MGSFVCFFLHFVFSFFFFFVSFFHFFVSFFGGDLIRQHHHPTVIFKLKEVHERQSKWDGGKLNERVGGDQQGGIDPSSWFCMGGEKNKK